MQPLTEVKLALAFVGIVLFGWGVRTDDNMLRWIGIGFVAAAVILRFVRPRKSA